MEDRLPSGESGPADLDSGLMKPPVVVVMGVSGSGKTTLGHALSARLHLPFAEGDDLHSPESIERMRGGEPLDDSHRAPWLERVAAWIATADRHGGVMTCSALKLAYRDRLRGANPRVRFVLLAADRTTLARRLHQRRGHFMSADLLQSQLDTFEPPHAAELDVLRLPADVPIERNLADVVQWLAAES